jgi:crotonobetainyl-CoA:carnitine CoA-transferase CaiB-like acyl-CoA transferase
MPGPYATLLLADLGADVVKVEDPDPGDFLREVAPPMFAVLNRGKRSIALDLKSAEGTSQLRRLCGSADVLIESFRPGVLERLLPPPWPSRLIVCRISGFGQTGPWRERAGHDIGYLALSGVLALNRGVPAVQLADLFGGAQQAAIGVLAALVERAQSGQGRVIDVSMTEGVTGLLLPHLGEDENVIDGSRPCYRVYACARGAYALGALEPKFWLRFCEAVGRAEWASRAFDLTLVPELDALFATRTRDEWAALLEPFDCSGEPVLEPSELRTHPLFQARALFAGDLPRTFPALVPTSDLPLAPAPAHGQHTEEVLLEWQAGSR